MENNFQELITYIENQTAFRCKSYKEKPLKRRIKVRMRALGLSNFSDYHNYLRDNYGELKKLLDALTINLSYFFRNPETFDYIKNHIFSDFKRRGKVLTFWSAGCARGEEPYSLAIIAAESALLNKVMVYGTDIDSNALEIARRGVYSSLAFEYTPENILQNYFERSSAHFLIKEQIKKRVNFLNLDLFDLPSFGLCDLIICRNVMIYLDRRAQSVIIKNFYNQLKPGGYLVIGKIELLIGVPEVKLFEVVNRVEHVYRKR